LSNLALIYYGSKDYKNAKRYYTQAIKAARNSDDISHREEAKVSSDLGGCYFKEDNLPAAEKWFRAAIAFDPALVEAHYNLVNLLLKEDRREEARQELTVAAQLAPSTRYGLFEGRLRGKQNWDEWNPTWVKVLVAVVLAGLVIVPVVRWVINRK